MMGAVRIGSRALCDAYGQCAVSCAFEGENTQADGRNRVKKLKKFFRKAKSKFSLLLLIPIVLLVLLLTGGYFLFFAGDDDDGDRTANSSQSSSQSGDNGSDDETTTLEKPKAPKVEPDQPSGREFTIDSDRDEKDYALAQAIGAIKTPAKIGLRLGAAPKQPVTVNASITCQLTNEGTKSSLDTFTVTPPHTRDLKLPVDDAVSCTASVGAQLTQAGRGRIKIFLIGTRRADS
jgi:hypothetical protein